MTTKAQKTQIYKKDSIFDIQLNMSSEKNNYIIQDENFNILDVSRGFLNLTGHNSFSEVNNPKDFFVNLSDNDLKISRGAVSRMADNDIAESEVKLAFKKDGTNLYVVDKIRWVRGIEGTRYLWTEILDVTELIVSQKINEALLSQGNLIILNIDIDGMIVSCSNAWESFSGYKSDETIGRNITEFIYTSDYNFFKHQDFVLWLRKNTYTKQYVKNKKGFNSNVMISVEQIAENFSQNNLMLTIMDIKKQTIIEKQLQSRLDRDELTNLYTRNYLNTHFGNSKRTNDYIIYIIDIDYFKNINDVYGHIAGDNLLVEISKTLANFSDENTTCFRLGGEEFAIISKWEEWQKVRKVSENLKMDIAKTFIHQDGHKVYCTASIGAGLFKKTQPLRTGLQFTDLLMREAKSMGRNGYVIGDPITIQKLKNDGKFTSMKEVQNALEDQEIEYFVQPIVDAVNGHILGFEALARWIKSNGEIFEPKKFIDILYQTARQPKYLKLKAKMRFELLKALEKFPNQYLSFNMKIELLSHENAAEEIHESILGSMGSETIQNREIILELSERAITERTNSDVVIKQLEKLKLIGYKIALDDFGIESSNIQRLQDYPIDIVKVDRRFIKKIGIDDTADLLLSALIKLITTLKLKIIIEGVETEWQRQKLLSMGTPFHQGFLYCKPVAVKTLTEATKHLSL
tara:strand:+ start:1237 stop:3300 length:2064 start_codon:yes stop_codon:yes gene_type:complete